MSARRPLRGITLGPLVGLVPAVASLVLALAPLGPAAAQEPRAPSAAPKAPVPSAAGAFGSASGITEVLATGLAGETFVALSYHDIRDDVRPLGRDPDPLAISTARLVEHFEWLRSSGYTPVSLDDLLAARRGDRALPDRPVLLTFDDGLESVYTRVFPLLELYDFPAVVSVVGGWIDAPPGWSMEYDGIGRVTREDFVSWEELREMKASGLVEVASHSWDLHRGVTGNPFGNEQPAAVTRARRGDPPTYETRAEWEERVRSDLARSARRIEEELGERPRVVVWPYGAYSPSVEAIAAELGMTVSLGLKPGPQPVDRLTGVRRFLVSEDATVPDLAWFVERSLARPRAERVVHVDLDYLFDPSPEQTERNLDHFLERILRLAPTTVYLQAFADPDGDGTASALYFPNRHLPMRADLFNRVAWQLKTRLDVDVYAWMPVLAFELPDSARNDALSVKRWSPDGSGAIPSRPDYRRLSPWSPEARGIIGDLYEDLAVHAALDGLAFHDDAYLGELEGASAYPQEPGRLPTAREKTRTLLDFTDELAARVREHRPQIRTARNLYARAALHPENEGRFAQDLESFLDRYDWTAVMAMPFLEGVGDPDGWLDRLVTRVGSIPGALSRTLFELQSVDWSRGSEPVPPSRLADWMRRLERRGAIHFGYYPDDFVRNVPRLDEIRSAFSTRSEPWTGR